MSGSIDTELETLIRARYPIIYVVSWEEKRVENAMRAISQARGKKMLQWTVTQGLVFNPTNRDEATRDPMAALDYVNESRDQAVFLFKDLHPFLSDTTLVRRLRDLADSLRTSYKTIVMLSPILKLPQELEKEITVVDYALPTLEDLGNQLTSIISSFKSNPQVNTELTEEQREQVLKAALGLTATEAENVFAKSLVEKRSFDVDVILSEKEQIIRKSGILEYYPATEAFADVGGLDLLKEWMSKRTVAFTEKARLFGLPAPKGVLMLGVQGCGKSLSAKAIASLWKLPLLRMDVGKIFGGIVGQSEENIRKAIRIAESTAPNVVWIDELEKGFSGTQGSGISDGGTTMRVFGTFITWLADKTAPCFVVATANDVTSLPPELLRKGRFDEIFFVDLPTEKERGEVFSIHLKKRKRDTVNFDVDALAQASPGYSGAEIEQAVISALYDAFDLDREIATDDILSAIRQSVPLSLTMKERINDLRAWAAHRARPASSQPPEMDFFDSSEDLLSHFVSAMSQSAAPAAAEPVAGESALTEPEAAAAAEPAAAPSAATPAETAQAVQNAGS
jgi:SpoVK/Ycf46/Vps4 family AAA+-type ATPase